MAAGRPDPCAEPSRVGTNAQLNLPSRHERTIEPRRVGTNARLGCAITCVRADSTGSRPAFAPTRHVRGPGQPPVTIQAVPRARRTSTTARLPMKPTPKATHSQTSAGAERRRAGPRRQGQRREDREHHDAAPGQVAAVAGADQHAVQHEDHPGHRLEARRPPAAPAAAGRAPAGSSVNSAPSTGAAAASSEPGDHAADAAPSGTIRSVTARVPARSPAPSVAAGDRLGGDRDGVEREGQERPAASAPAGGRPPRRRRGVAAP